MEAVTEQPFLVRLAADIAKWFPELGGRSLAVMEAQFTKQNIPTLPLAMVAPVRETAGDGATGAAIKDGMPIATVFVVEFLLNIERYKRADHTETPFWAYYDFEAMRNRLLTAMSLSGYRGPHNSQIRYTGMRTEADEFAITLSFNFTTDERWCVEKVTYEPPDGDVITSAFFKTKICVPRTEYCPECISEVPEEDPCP